MRRKFDIRNKRSFIVIMVLAIVFIIIFSLFIVKYTNSLKVGYVVETYYVFNDRRNATSVPIRHFLFARRTYRLQNNRHDRDDRRTYFQFFGDGRKERRTPQTFVLDIVYRFVFLKRNKQHIGKGPPNKRASGFYFGFCLLATLFKSTFSGNCTFNLSLLY